MNSYLHGHRCESFGVQFELNADSEFLLGAMLRCAPLGTRVCADRFEVDQQFSLSKDRGAGGYRLTVGCKVHAEDVALQPVLDQLARELMVHVANCSPDRVFVHAGVIGWHDRALVLPGTSFAGKTTLVAELVRAGATYYSDEYAVLDEHGWVYPYPRELQMRAPGGFEQRAIDVEELEGSAGTKPICVSQVVFTTYVESGRWNPEAVTAGMAVLEMLRHTIPVQRAPARVMATLAKMMEQATALRSERGEAAEMAASLLHAM